MSWVELVVGAVFGLVLALLVQPLLEDPARSLLVRILGRFSPVGGRSKIAGEWFLVWWKDGTVPSRDLEQRVVLRTVGTRVAGKFAWKGRTYQLIGSRHTPQFVSGTYVDADQGNVFHGAFQLRVFPGDTRMAGRWMGFNTNQVIMEGPWYLRRTSETEYSFERAEGDPAAARPVGGT